MSRSVEIALLDVLDFILLPCLSLTFFFPYFFFLFFFWIENILSASEYTEKKVYIYSKWMVCIWKENTESASHWTCSRPLCNSNTNIKTPNEIIFKEALIFTENYANALADKKKPIKRTEKKKLTPI